MDTGKNRIGLTLLIQFTCNVFVQSNFSAYKMLVTAGVLCKCVQQSNTCLFHRIFLLICKKKLGPGDRVLIHLVLWLYVVAATRSLSALVPYAINIAIIDIHPPKNPHQNVWKILCLVPRWHVCHCYTDLKFYKETSRWKSTVRSVIDSYMYQTIVYFKCIKNFPLT